MDSFLSARLPRESALGVAASGALALGGRQVPGGPGSKVPGDGGGQVVSAWTLG